MLGYEYNVQPYFLQEFMTPSSHNMGLENLGVSGLIAAGLKRQFAGRLPNVRREISGVCQAESAAPFLTMSQRRQTLALVAQGKEGNKASPGQYARTRTTRALSQAFASRFLYAPAGSSSPGSPG